MARVNLKFLNAASRERFPFGVPHESQRYMQRLNRDQRYPKKNERRSIMRLALRTIVRACLVSLLLTLLAYESKAQDSAIASGTGGRIGVEEMAAKSSGIAVNDTRYRIGPGDVLDVRVARAPDLSREAVRVDQSGNIRMPMLDADIPAACQTEGEVAQN